MPLTLVSHYGEKPAGFVRLIGELQRSLADSLGDQFHPYEIRQVHGTIIGLEGSPVAGGVRNENFLRYQGEERFMDFVGLLHFLRNDFAEIVIQLGGFSAGTDYGFTSQGQHPFLRSFSLQQEITVAMGWSMQNGKHSCALDDLRRRIRQFGLLHKWHRNPQDVDNDFFFVLGRINGVLPDEKRSAIEHDVRTKLSYREPLLLSIDRDALAFVMYCDPQLPLASSRALRLSDAHVAANLLKSAYAGSDSEH